MNEKQINQSHESRNETGDTREKFPPMGHLKNGNPAGNPNNAPRCGAKRRKREERCQAPAMANGRCRLHGGLCTGPRTPEGLERSRRGNWKHGERSKAVIEARRVLSAGMALLLSPDKLMTMSPEEIQAHHAALNRLVEKINKFQF